MKTMKSGQRAGYLVRCLVYLLIEIPLAAKSVGVSRRSYALDGPLDSCYSGIRSL